MRQARPWSSAAVALLIGSSPGVVLAQEAPRASAPYEGVTPGTDHRPPAEARIGRARGRGRRAANQILTWPGFQASPDGTSRFFVQTTGPVTASVVRGEGRVEIVFPATGTHLGNSRLWLETQYFETPVTRARLERRGRDMVLVLLMRADVTPAITTGTGEGGYFFTYVEFAAGHYLPDAPPAPIAPRGSVGVVRSEPERAPSAADAASAPAAEDPSMRALDDERPPPARGPRP